MLKKWRHRLRDWARDILAVWMGLRDPRVPILAKLSGLLAVLYVVAPLDLIPDVIPVIGWLDDLAALPLASYVASRLIPFQLMAELRERADIRIHRWGPRFGRMAVLFVCLWLALAMIGGMLFYSRMQAALAPSPMRETAPVSVYSGNGESQRRQADISAPPAMKPEDMLALADNYFARGTTESRNAARFLWEEIVRQHPDSTAAETARARLLTQ